MAYERRDKMKIKENYVMEIDDDDYDDDDFEYEDEEFEEDEEDK
jgi:hypothetical protein